MTAIIIHSQDAERAGGAKRVRQKVQRSAPIGMDVRDPYARFRPCRRRIPILSSL